MLKHEIEVFLLFNILYGIHKNIEVQNALLYIVDKLFYLNGDSHISHSGSGIPSLPQGHHEHESEGAIRTDKSDKI